MTTQIQVGFADFGDWVRTVFRVWAAQWGMWTLLTGLLLLISGAVLGVETLLALAPTGIVYVNFWGWTYFVHTSDPQTNEVFSPGLLSLLIAILVLTMVVEWLYIGYMKAALKAIRGKSICVDDLFSGGDYLFPAVCLQIGALLLVLGIHLAKVVITFDFIAAIDVRILTPREAQFLMDIVQYAAEVLLITLTCLSLAYIIDWRYDPVEAFKLSMQKVCRAFWFYMGFISFMLFLSCAGAITFVGILVTLPWLTIAKAVAYERTFWGKEGRNPLKKAVVSTAHAIDTTPVSAGGEMVAVEQSPIEEPPSPPEVKEVAPPTVDAQRDDEASPLQE